MVELRGKWSSVCLTMWRFHAYLHAFSLSNFSIILSLHSWYYMPAVGSVFGIWIRSLSLGTRLHLETLFEVFNKFFIKLLLLLSPQRWILSGTRVLRFLRLLGLNLLLNKSLQILYAISSTLLYQSIFWGKLLAWRWISNVLVAAGYAHRISITFITRSVWSFSGDIAPLFIQRRVKSLRIIRNLILI